MQKVKFNIPNISCGHCVATIKNELCEIEGINNVEGNFQTKQINVEFELPATLDKIVDKLAEINYPVG
ncbi:MAG TPA: heavy-metal-associated domain-containing protein [Bellilinea sp.]|nr:heavy-metal-associated domain-containing protein [Bellilinea sp.]